MLLKDKSPDAADRLRWRWSKGGTTAKTEFGDPIATTAYALCIYDEANAVPSLALRASIPPGGACDGVSCWHETSTGFEYKDHDATRDGIDRITLREGPTPGHARILVTGSGATLPLPTLPLAQHPRVTVQLRNAAGGCWGSVHGTAIRNDASQFKARSD